MNRRRLRTWAIACAIHAIALPAFAEPQLAPALGSPQLAPALGSPQLAPALDSPQLAPALDALAQGHHDEAIASLEQFANQGVLDAAASFNRGLAYAERAASDQRRPGDFGQAIAAFEEAQQLSPDRAVAERADHAADAVRGALAKQRSRDGARASYEPAPSLGSRLADLLPELGWLVLAAVLAASAALGSVWRRGEPAYRAALQLGVLLALPCLAAAQSVRHRRHEELRAVVLVEGTRAVDRESRQSVSDQPPLPEGAMLPVRERGGELLTELEGRTVVLPRANVRLLAR